MTDKAHPPEESAGSSARPGERREGSPPPGAAGTAGLPLIDTIINDPAAQAAVLARLQRLEGRQPRSTARYLVAGIGAVLLLAGVVVGSRLYTEWRASRAVDPGAPVAVTPPPTAPEQAPPGVPRPVATSPVRVEGGPTEQRPLLSTEWLRAHEALGLPPPKLVRTVKIIPPRAE